MKEELNNSKYSFYKNGALSSGRISNAFPVLLYLRVGQYQNRRTGWPHWHSDELCASGSKVPTSGAEI
jgi:hypothetical protein